MAFLHISTSTLAYNMNQIVIEIYIGIVMASFQETAIIHLICRNRIKWESQLQLF